VDQTGFFHEINCAQFSQLIIASDTEIFSAIDQLATITSKKRLEQLEKSSGINFRPHGFWNDPAVRDRLPPSHVLGDPMHIFWANGTMSSEINLFMMAFQNRFDNVAILTDALLGIGFESAGTSARTAHVKKLLNHKLFQGPVYKGSARECASVIWLIWFAIQTLLVGKNVLQDEVASFSACIELCRTIRPLVYSTTVTENDALLFSSQVDRHQRAFNVAYPDETRPKNHQRHHLVESMLAIKKYMHCEAYDTFLCREGKHFSFFFVSGIDSLHVFVFVSPLCSTNHFRKASTNASKASSAHVCLAKSVMTTCGMLRYWSECGKHNVNLCVPMTWCLANSSNVPKGFDVPSIQFLSALFAM